jgi:N-acyl-phosphatidylethanolamine-hydrolysing phospholipase D
MGEGDPAAFYAEHRDQRGRFFNPWRRMEVRFRDVLRWKLSGSEYDRSKPLEVPRVPGDAAALAAPVSRPAVTWIGHATFALQDGSALALTDPHFGPRALVPRRLTPPGLPVEAVPPHAIAVLSHNHYDHLDRWTVRRLPRSVAWFVPLGNAAWLRRQGVERITELDWWQSADGGGWRLTCLPAQHWSNRLSVARDGALWASWLLETATRRFYFGGDSGWFGGFAEIGRRFPGIDAALLPIGAYEPRWFMGYQHLDPAQAWRAFQALGARWMLPMHWGAFDLTDEPAALAPRELARAVAAAGGDAGRVRLLAVGERWLLGDGPGARAARFAAEVETAAHGPVRLPVR